MAVIDNVSCAYKELSRETHNLDDYLSYDSDVLCKIVECRSVLEHLFIKNNLQCK